MLLVAWWSWIGWTLADAVDGAVWRGGGGGGLVQDSHEWASVSGGSLGAVDL